jgi:hypothetical protein
VRIASAAAGDVLPLGQERVPSIERRLVFGQERSDGEIRRQAEARIGECEQRRQVIGRRKTEIVLPNVRTDVRVEVVDLEPVDPERAQNVERASFGVRLPHERSRIAKERDRVGPIHVVDRLEHHGIGGIGMARKTDRHQRVLAAHRHEDAMTVVAHVAPGDDVSRRVADHFVARLEP